MTTRDKKFEESTLVLLKKYKGMKDRNINLLDDFEFEMFKAIERTLGERGYFNDKRVARPLFWGPA